LIRYLIHITAFFGLVVDIAEALGCTCIFSYVSISVVSLLSLIFCKIIIRKSGISNLPNFIPLGQFL